MPYTVLRTIEDINRNSEMGDLNRTDGLRMINKVFRDLCVEFPIAIGNRIVPVTASVQEFALLETELSVTQATFFGSAGASDWNVLDGSNSLEDLNEIDENWRYVPPSRPLSFYVSAGNIGLYPRSNATTPNNAQGQQDTSGNSYPYVQIWTYNYPGDLAINDNLPITLQSNWSIVMGSCILLNRKDPAAAGQYAAEFESELVRLERFLGRRDKRHKNQIYPWTMGQALV